MTRKKESIYRKLKGIIGTDDRKDLYRAIEENSEKQATALKKHLAASGIRDWEDLTKSRLFEFRDRMLEQVAASSARTYMASLRAVMARYDSEMEIPCREYRDVLRMRNEKAVKTYLTPEELTLLERVETHGRVEDTVKHQFLIGAYTGMRISDIRTVTAENITDGILRYVSRKTSVKAAIPCSERLGEWISLVNGHGEDVSLAGYNNAIRRLCRRAGIDERVKVFRKGATETGEKWEFISSHSARISFATNLADCNVPILAISKMMGHTSVTMTQGYIASDIIRLNDQAMTYLNK